jgi:hypothetical protein
MTQSRNEVGGGHAGKDHKGSKDPRTGVLAVPAVLVVLGRGWSGPQTLTLPGPAAFTSSVTPDSYFLKFSANMSASWEALAS